MLNVRLLSAGLDVAGPDGMRPGLWPLSPGLPDGGGSGLEALTEQLGEALNNCAPQDVAGRPDGELGPRRGRVRGSGLRDTR